jgi:hypothetical protein
VRNWKSKSLRKLRRKKNLLKLSKLHRLNPLRLLLLAKPQNLYPSQEFLPVSASILS